MLGLQPPNPVTTASLGKRLTRRAALAGLLFAGMAVISLVGIMPASFVADKLGRKWTIVPSCLGLAASLLLMALTGDASTSSALYALSVGACCWT